MLASYWHRILQLVCQSKQCQPLLERHLQQAKQVLSLFNHTSNAIFHGKKINIVKSTRISICEKNDVHCSAYEERRTFKKNKTVRDSHSGLELALLTRAKFIS